MSDTKHGDFEHISHGNQLPRQLTTVTLTAEQFESLYLQPRNSAGTKNALVGKVGNPTPLGVSAFLLAHMPLSMDLLNFQGATAASSVAMLGSFYACAGIGLYLACIMEWLIGNTFPCVVFGTFGGFWISYAINVQPTLQLAASFAPASDVSNGITAAAAGAATPQYNAGLGLYFTVWGIMCAIYFLASLRTNVPFAVIFASLVFAFELIAAAYFHTGQGRLELAALRYLDRCIPSVRSCGNALPNPADRLIESGPSQQVG
ncbi:uncharacterized protein FOMMEDRAFT_26712 [Fomitiporia mediterranea MF3/22]|uniref:uncharacterized protein n=1 Tax=Fomitiporia mediterranea (strain MF3/22) TaxID=694068 RepID=UPI0004407FD2|nr:uncharacterized protein FOMMEDRAFT_26712 [Fomitiporia mediterranea MF3/22]EJD05917.1 hypothetical protein FOMMEDRAFT_26712 [Fomitiporia mediterranea MF3/22]